MLEVLEKHNHVYSYISNRYFVDDYEEFCSQARGKYRVVDRNAYYRPSGNIVYDNSNYIMPDTNYYDSSSDSNSNTSL